MDKRADLRNLGLEENDIACGNVGFEIEDEEGYFAREKAENRLAEGLPVPERYLPLQKGQYEKDLWRHTKDMERLELARTTRENEPDFLRMRPEYEEEPEEETLKRKGRTLARNEVVKNVTQTKRSVVTVVTKQEKAKEAEKSEDKKSGELLDFQDNRAYVLKGEFKFRKIWSKKKEKWMFALEGENRTIIVGGAGADGKNVWALLTESGQKSSNPSMSEIEA